MFLDVPFCPAGMRVRLELSPDTEGSWVVADVGLAYGGVAPKSIMAEKVRLRCAVACSAVL